MPSELNHPVFVPPPDLKVKIWRYMDLSKYVSLLQNAALFFSRADLLGDPYEGAVSHANKRMRATVYGPDHPASMFADQMSAISKWQRQWTFINCWHMNAYESDAMWKLYARTADAVAIQSTYKRFQEALPSGTFLGVVKYIDYDSDWMPEGNLFEALMHKRMSFEHERELRALFQTLSYKPTPNGSAIDQTSTNNEAGRMVPIQLSQLIEKVYIAPTSPAWFGDVVRKMTERYELDVPVEQSALDHAPEF